MNYKVAREIYHKLRSETKRMGITDKDCPRQHKPLFYRESGSEDPLDYIIRIEEELSLVRIGYQSKMHLLECDLRER